MKTPLRSSTLISARLGILLAGVFLLFGVRVAFADYWLSNLPEHIVAEAGASFTTDLKISASDSSAGAFSIMLRYDPSVVRISQITPAPGSPLNGNLFFDSSSYSSGETRIVAFQTSDTWRQLSEELLCTVHWQAVGRDRHGSDLSVVVETLVDTKWIPVNLGITSSRIDIVSSLQSWKLAYWPGDPNGSEAADTADPDGDGITNTAEYAFKMDPTRQSKSGLPTTILGGQYLDITFLRARIDVIYEVQKSTNLQTWTTVATNPGAVGELVTVSVPTNGVPNMFLRVKLLPYIPVGFESGLADWSVDNDGVWEVGVPTSGPGGPHSGINCAATILNGNYPNSADSRLISPTFVVPGAVENPRLRFWHWFSSWPQDQGKVEVRLAGSGTWTAIPPTYFWNSAAWTRASVDLSAYAGQTIQVAFHFTSDGGSNAPGWYVDEVMLVTGPIAPLVPNVTESFESGLGDWAAERGVWEVGVPNPGIGPGTAHSGTNCAATILNGNYPDLADSRLISPPFVVPGAVENPRLRFWHWFSSWSTDLCKVEVRPVGASTWTAIPPTFFWNSAAWTRASVDLSGYAGQTIQVAFHFTSDGGSNAPGWYVDEVTLVTGPIVPLVPNVTESFESGLGDWAVERGVWEVGVPKVGVGPGAAHSGTNCAGTVLNGNYPDLADSRLISPPFVVPGAGQNPRLRFWHWFSSWSTDLCKVEVRTAGSSTWTAIPPTYFWNSAAWTRASVDLSAYAGQTIQVAFHFTSDGGSTAPGWYVDEVTLVTGPIAPLVPNVTESFESGLGEWAAERGVWEVGVPKVGVGPGAAHSGTNCAGTVLNGNYPDLADSRLISPSFMVPSAGQNPRLRFWYWFNSWPQDQGKVEVRPVGSGTWTAIPPTYSGNSGIWIQVNADLSAYAGQVIQVAFHFTSDGGSNATGWYVDEVTLTTANGLSSFQNWRSMYFPHTASTGIAADTADPDGDGISNLLEFATNTDSTASNAVPCQVVRNGSLLKFTYMRSKAAMSDGVTFAVEWSDDLSLGSWTNGGVSESVLGEDAAVQQVMASLPAGPNGKRFVRLKVTATP